MKILVVEDEKALSEDIIKFLSGENYLCESAYTLKEGQEKIQAYEYDCILLDLMIPGGDGLSLLNELKRLNRADGVIIISAKNSIDDKITGLQIGADDYITKPFHQAELSARIHSVIRRKQFDNANTISQDELSIDLLSKKVSVNGVSLTLTRKEFDLLLFFIGNKNRVLSKGALAEHLSGDLADMFDSHDFVYAHIKNLKRKLKEGGANDYIKTVYGVGYKWEKE